MMILQCQQNDKGDFYQLTDNGKFILTIENYKDFSCKFIPHPTSHQIGVYNTIMSMLADKMSIKDIVYRFHNQIDIKTIYKDFRTKLETIS